MSATTQHASLKGIDGWLYLPLIGLLSTIAKAVILITKDRINHLPLTSWPTIMALVVGVYAATCLVFFFQERGIARYLMLGYFAYFPFVGFVVSASTDTATEMNLLQWSALMFNACIGVVFFVYFLLSKRVNQTFVN